MIVKAYKTPAAAFEAYLTLLIFLASPQRRKFERVLGITDARNARRAYRLARREA